MQIINWQACDSETKNKILRRGHIAMHESLKNQVAEIIAKVRSGGDTALRELTLQFDGAKIGDLKLDLSNAPACDAETLSAIKFAHDNIKRYHESQSPKSHGINENGVDLWQETRPIESVGLYIPAGSAPLISTLLMLAIPAKIAKCPRIFVCSPPDKNGNIHPAIILAAQVCGIDEIYTIGGAQAIAAMAYGTETIPKAYKIFGPGNKYVTEAKIQAAMDNEGAALDMQAGPSEVLVIADASANCDFIAADLLAQGEHDPDSGVICICDCEKMAIKIQESLNNQLRTAKRHQILEKSLANGAIIIAKDMNHAIEISNQYAPEHLLLQMQNPRQYLSQITNAGSVFIGNWSAEALGDYASGPNHVIPTYGYAKNTSALSVASFCKFISFQEISPKGFRHLAPAVAHLAQLEGLDAHFQAVKLRQTEMEKNDKKYD